MLAVVTNCPNLTLARKDDLEFGLTGSDNHGMTTPLTTDLTQMAESMEALAAQFRGDPDARIRGMGDGLLLAAVDIRRYTTTVIDLRETR